MLFLPPDIIHIVTLTQQHFVDVSVVKHYFFFNLIFLREGGMEVKEMAREQKGERERERSRERGTGDKQRWRKQK